MGIYERDLSTFDERPLIENTQFEGCVNCHSFNRGNPADMSLHIRGPHSATLLRHSQSSSLSSIPPSDGRSSLSSIPPPDGRSPLSSIPPSDGRSSLSSIPPPNRRATPFTAYNTKTPETLGLCVYPYWHPSGRYIAYSTNTTRQLFHSADPNRIEVFDEASDLQVYDVEKNELLLSPLLKQDSIYETYPVFSADGRSLYFCAAVENEELKMKNEEFPSGHGAGSNNEAAADSSFFILHSSLNDLRYNLCRIDFDPATGTFGNRIDTIVNAASQHKSISFPRPSYDGRFLCYTLSDYGQFCIWHHEADLYLLDLATGVSRLMDGANSEDTESFHNWSTNSRWLVLSSRRDDGLFTRPYFCHVNADGVVSKAFMLPQRNPRRFYRDRFFSFNVPEFIIAPTQFDGDKASRIINDESRTNFGVRK